MALTGKFSDWFRFGNTLTSVDEFLDYWAKMSDFDPETNIGNINSEIFFQFALNDSITKWYKANHAMNEKVFNDAKDWLLEKISSL